MDSSSPSQSRKSSRESRERSDSQTHNSHGHSRTGSSSSWTCFRSPKRLSHRSGDCPSSGPRINRHSPSSSSSSDYSLSKRKCPRSANRPSSSSSHLKLLSAGSPTDPANSNPSSNLPNLESAKLIKQLVIRARPQPIPSPDPIPLVLSQSSPPNQNQNQNQIDLVICLTIAIPYDALPSSPRPPIVLPLMPDNNLRLKRASVFPLSRRSNHSRPSLDPSSHPAHAKSAAAILNLSNSLPNSRFHPPLASVTITNFAISLIISCKSIHPHPSTFAEYAILLDCQSQWATVGPHWPFSLVLPTPPCLRNSFRLLLPPHSPQAPLSTGIHALDPSSLHLTTFPSLRQESLHSIPRSRTSLASHRLAGWSDDNLPSLSDESEPDCPVSSSSEEDDTHSSNRLDWTQDLSLPHFQGVFQSTTQLCIVLGHHPVPDPELDPDRARSPLTSSISAKRASSSLSLALHPQLGPPTNDEHQSVSLHLNFHLELDHLSTHSITNKIPFVLTLPDEIASDLISVQWSSLIGDGVIESALPSLAKSGPQTISTSSSLAPTSNPSPTTPRISPSPSPNPNLSSSLDDLDLLNTLAPFSDPKWPTDPDPDPEPASSFGLRDQTNSPIASGSQSPSLSSRGSSKASASSLQFQPPDQHAGGFSNRLVAWIDGEWLLRTVANSSSPDKFRLVFNLHGQLDMAVRPRPGPSATKPSFLMPFLTLPSVGEHTCVCEFSAGSMLPSGQDGGLGLSLPSWATELDQSSEHEARRIEMRLPSNADGHGVPGEMIVVHLPSHEPAPSLLLAPATPVPVMAMASVEPSYPTLGSPLNQTSPAVSTQTVTPLSKITTGLSAGSASQEQSRMTVEPMCVLRKRKLVQSNSRAREDDDDEGDVQAGVSAVDVRVVVDPVGLEPGSSGAGWNQYCELSMALVWPELELELELELERSGELVVCVRFGVGPDDDVDLVGVWLGAREVGRGKGVEVRRAKVKEARESREARGVRSEEVEVAVEVKLGGLGGRGMMEIPLLKMVVKTRTQDRRQGQAEVLVLPSFGSPVGVYRVTVEARRGVTVAVDETEMVVLGRSGAGQEVRLVGYAVSGPRTAVRVCREQTGGAERWRVGLKIAILCWLVVVLVRLGRRMEGLGARVEWLGAVQQQTGAQCVRQAHQTWQLASPASEEVRVADGELWAAEGSEDGDYEGGGGEVEETGVDGEHYSLEDSVGLANAPDLMEEQERDDEYVVDRDGYTDTDGEIEIEETKDENCSSSNSSGNKERKRGFPDRLARLKRRMGRIVEKIWKGLVG